ncbi:MAG: hypothetical protein ABJE95_02215 [Byssovorax sp.]
MSVFSGTFVDASGRGEHPTGLAGPGTIRLEPSRLVITGQRPRAALASVGAGFVAFLLLILFVTALVMGSFTGSKPTFVDLKLVVVIGAAFAVGCFLGLRTVLLKVLPLQSTEVAVELPFVVLARLNGGNLELLTTSPDLAGLSAFQVVDAIRFVEELEIARRGSVKGYR